MFTKVDFVHFQTNNPITNVRITNEIGHVFYNISKNVDSGITLLEKYRAKSAVVPIVLICNSTSFEVNKKLAETIHNN
jgi:hypothetical protein